MHAVVVVAVVSFVHDLPFPMNFSQSVYVPTYAVHSAVDSIHPVPSVTHPVKNVSQSTSVVAVVLWLQVLSIQAPFVVVDVDQHFLPLPVNALHPSWFPYYPVHGVVPGIHPFPVVIHPVKYLSQSASVVDVPL